MMMMLMGGTRKSVWDAGVCVCVCDFYTVYTQIHKIYKYMLMKFAVFIIPIQGDKCIKLLGGLSLSLLLFASSSSLYIHIYTLQCLVVRNHHL